MSIYTVTNPNNKRLVHLGMDAPTGGYHFTEFLNEDEAEGADDEVVYSDEGMTLSQLRATVGLRLQRDFTEKEEWLLLNDYYTATLPTPFQRNVNEMFGVDWNARWTLVSRDINENWGGNDD